MVIENNLKNIYPTENGTNSIHDSFTVSNKRTLIHWGLWLEIAQGTFQVVLYSFLTSST